MNISILNASTTPWEAMMQEIHKAKLFKNGGSQAIRIPAQWRFDSDEVYVRFDEALGGLVITQRNPRALDRFFAMVAELGPEPEPEWPENWRDYPESPRPGWEALINERD